MSDFRLARPRRAAVLRRLLRHDGVLGGQEVLDGLDQVAIASLEHQLQNGPLLGREYSLQDFDVGETSWSEGRRDGRRVRRCLIVVIVVVIIVVVVVAVFAVAVVAVPIFDLG